MSEMQNKYEALSKEETTIFTDNLKTYLGYEAEIKDFKDSQKELVGVVCKKLKDWKKKEVKKLFIYFKRKVSAKELREDADFIEAISSSI